MQALAGTDMFVLNLVFFLLLVASTAYSGISPYILGQWIIAEENPQYEYDGLIVAESIWPVSPAEVFELVTEDQTWVTTLEPYVMKEQADGGKESAVWKIVLVTAILLVSIAGSLGMAYYMCVWRGGRIHYKPQKNGYA